MFLVGSLLGTVLGDSAMGAGLEVLEWGLKYMDVGVPASFRGGGHWKLLPFLALFDLLKAGDEVTPDLGKEFEEPGLTGAGDSDLRIVIFRSTRFSLGNVVELFAAKLLFAGLGLGLILTLLAILGCGCETGTDPGGLS